MWARGVWVRELIASDSMTLRDGSYERLQTDCGTPQSVTSATIKSAHGGGITVACGAACGDARVAGYPKVVRA